MRPLVGVLAVELSRPQGHEGELPFEATGAAVDDGVICGEGSMELVRLESVDGGEIPDEDWATTFDAAMEFGGFTVGFHNRFDFATSEFEGLQNVGTWEIGEGTGSYEDLAGSGDVTLDWDVEQAIYSGDAQS